MRQTKSFAILGHFLTLCFPNNSENQHFEKKSTWRYLSKFFISFEESGVNLLDCKRLLGSSKCNLLKPRQLPSFFEFSDELIWFLSQNLIIWCQVHNLLQNTRFPFSDDYTWYYDTTFGNFYFDHEKIFFQKCPTASYLFN